MDFLDYASFMSPAVWVGNSVRHLANSGNEKSTQNVGLMQGLENSFTGNLDYQRQLELQGIANTFSAQEAQKQRDFEERLSNTAYSRAVSDMRNAGLNPYLLYASGKALSASTPSGSAATAVTGNAPTSGRGFQAMLSALGMLVSSAVSSGIRAHADMNKPAPVYNRYNNTYYNNR